jgi:hypothetical protein
MEEEKSRMCLGNSQFKCGSESGGACGQEVSLEMAIGKELLFTKGLLGAATVPNVLHTMSSIFTGVQHGGMI